MNLTLLRSFFAIVEHGSLSQAAERLHVAQSTLSRQLQALEQEIGGALLERGQGGVTLSSTGHALFDGMQPVLASFDSVLGEVRRRARGQSAELRIGYLLSAASDYLNPALVALRKAHPEVKVRMLDLSPGEQIAALRKGDIDVGLIGQESGLQSNEFYVRTLAVLPVSVALPSDHPMAAAVTVKLAELRQELFVGAHESDLPGHNLWVSRLCKRAGFRARFVQDADSLTHALAMVVTEGAVLLLPDYAAQRPVPGVVFRPLSDTNAKWQLMVAWLRGKPSAPVKVLLAALPSGKRSG